MPVGLKAKTEVVKSNLISNTVKFDLNHAVFSFLMFLKLYSGGNKYLIANL